MLVDGKGFWLQSFPIRVYEVYSMENGGNLK